LEYEGLLFAQVKPEVKKVRHVFAINSQSCLRFNPRRFWLFRWSRCGVRKQIPKQTASRFLRPPRQTANALI